MAGPRNSVRSAMHGEAHVSAMRLECPSADTLAAFLAAKLPAEELGRIAAHLDTCDRCAQLVEHDAGQTALGDDVRWADGLRRETALDAATPLTRLNELLPDYEIVEELGRGGMGVVYRARQRKLDRWVALKVLPALLAAVRKEAAIRFRREAALAARLEHTNIIGVYDFGEVEGTLYYAMQLIEGRSLRQVLREIEATGAIDAVIGAGSRSEGGSRLDSERGCRSAERKEPSAAGAEPAALASQGRTGTLAEARLKPASAARKLGSSSATDRAYYRRVAEWTANVAEALDYAHEQGVIHRDVKPSNLLLANSGRLMISDFGLARATGVETVTASRALLGTARYMSPEQVSGDGPPIDRRVDVYGLGATLYELLAFRPMFAGTDDREILDCVLNREPVPPRRYVHRVPRELETICLKAVEKERDNRYATAKDLADDLRRWLLDLPINARRPSLPRRAVKLAKRRKASVALATITTVAAVTAASFYANYRNAARIAAAQQIDLATHEISRLIDHDENEDALKQAEEGLRLAPDSSAILNLKAAALINLRRWNEAVDVLEAMLVRRPDDILGHYRAARIMIGMAPVMAVKAYSPPGTDVDLPPAERRRRFELYRDKVARLEADSKYADVLAGLDESDPALALRHFDRALEKEKMWTDALELRAHIYDKLHNYAAMLQDCERLVSVSPDHADYHCLRGRALLFLGRCKEAEQAFSVCITREPRGSPFWQDRSTAKLMQGKAAEALADAERSIELDRENAGAYAARALARNGMGQYRRALADLAQAMRLEPGRADHAIARASVLYNLGQLEEAMADISRALELEPGNTRCLYIRSRILEDLGHSDRALADLTEVVRLTPGDATAYRNRAPALVRCMKYAEAVADYGQAIKLDGGTPSDFIGRAMLFVETGQRDLAVADLSRLVDREDLGDELRLRRGALYELMGDLESAETDYVAVSKAAGALGQYARLWRYLLLRMNQEAGNTEGILADADAEGGLDPWVAELYGVFRGETAPADLLASAATNAELCEARYYIGMQALIDGQVTDARDAFDACVKLNQSNVIESDFARVRLHALERRGPQGQASAAGSTP